MRSTHAPRMSISNCSAKSVKGVLMTDLTCDVLLLVDAFEHFRKTACNPKLDPATYLTSPCLPWGAMFVANKD